MFAPESPSNAALGRPEASVCQLNESLPAARASLRAGRDGGRRLTPEASRGKVKVKREALQRSDNPRPVTLPSARSETSEGRLEQVPIAPVSLKVEMFNLARQTENRLLALQGDVAECKSVDEAANFTRWLSSSGVLALLEMFTTDGSLAVNGPALRKLSQKILSDCGDLYRSGKATARYQSSDIAAINHKLDLIAGRIACLEFPPATSLPVQMGAQTPVTLDGVAGGPT